MVSCPLAYHLVMLKPNSQCKEKLVEGEPLVNSDFAENYPFVLQDEVQSYRWAMSQTMLLHPFIVYYKWH